MATFDKAKDFDENTNTSPPEDFSAKIICNEDQRSSSHLFRGEISSKKRETTKLQTDFFVPSSR